MPPLIIIVGIGIFLSLICSEDEKKSSPDTNPDADSGNFDPPAAGIEEPMAEPSVSQPITLDMLREVFQNGARPLLRRDAVELLKAAPYFVPKTNAYRALAPARRFAAHLREDGEGWLHFVP